MEIAFASSRSLIQTTYLWRKWKKYVKKITKSLSYLTALTEYILCLRLGWLATGRLRLVSTLLCSCTQKFAPVHLRLVLEFV